ncbi:hypothetical protein ACHAWF_009609 [Thalassiosira exigua]
MAMALSMNGQRTNARRRANASVPPGEGLPPHPRDGILIEPNLQHRKLGGQALRHWHLAHPLERKRRMHRSYGSSPSGHGCGKNKMPFHPPQLYRRNEDDYFFGHYPHLDDNGGVAGADRQKKSLRFKGMLRNTKAFLAYEEELYDHGYAVVDDALYRSDRYRDRTRLALTDSDVHLNPVVDEDLKYSPPAFEFKMGAEDQLHYITDDDGWDHYYSVDDAMVRGNYSLEEEHDEGESVAKEDDNTNNKESDMMCTLPAFYRMYHPTCNELHASLSGYQWLFGEEIYSRRWKRRNQLYLERSHPSKYLSHGYYRDAFVFQPLFATKDDKGKPSTQWDKVVFKTMRHMYESETAEADDDEVEDSGLGYDPEDKYTFLNYIDDMRKDAMVMELLHSSPRAIDIYSHCAMSSVIEFAPTDIEGYVMPTSGRSPKRFVRKIENEEDKEKPLNDHISPIEKLEIALEMAKCLAAMHGLEDGVIAHVDVQVGQFFRGRDGMIKLVDYNRAEPILYDVKHEKYCRETTGTPGDGRLRSPEENNDGPLTEKLDVFSLGNVFYSLLTGRTVWEDYAKEDYTEKIANGVTVQIPALNNNQTALEYLVRAMKSCWTFDLDERPTIFELVHFLEDAVARTKDQS